MATPAAVIRRALIAPFELLGTFLLSGLFSILPRGVAHALGRRMGRWAYFLSPRSRNVAKENLQLMLGVDAAGAARIAERSMRLAGAAFSDLLRAPRMRRLLARRDVEIPEETWQAIDGIRRGARGAVFAASHFGNWEFANLCGPYSALPQQTVVIRPIPNPLLHRYLAWCRGRTGQRLILRNMATTEAFHLVREGGICVITFDLPVPPDSGAVPVEFFGRPTYTTLGVGYVAAVTGAPVYLAHFEPMGGCRYRFVLTGPLQAAAGETLRATATETTRNVSRALESCIRARPEAWAWWLKRWKVRPDGARGGWPSYSVEVSWHWPRGTAPRRDHA